MEVPDDFLKDSIKQMYILSTYGISRTEYMSMAFWEIKELINVIKESTEKKDS